MHPSISVCATEGCIRESLAAALEIRGVPFTAGVFFTYIRAFGQDTLNDGSAIGAAVQTRQPVEQHSRAGLRDR